jgi:LuxR family transcriptional regulator, quorum-sensing system regulator BjaR1
MLELFALIEELNRKVTTAAVLDCVQSIIAPFGLKNVHIGGLPTQCFQSVSEATRWPREFHEIYVREQYVRVSPIGSQVRSSATPYEWRTADFAGERDPRARVVMERAADCGMRHGFVIPIHGPSGFEGAVSLDGSVVELGSHINPSLHLIALYAFDRVRTIVRPIRRERPILTAREREVLAWAANGKSAWEIGEILNITKRTVDEHAQTAFQKLGAANRTHAVAIALRERIIEP